MASLYVQALARCLDCCLSSNAYMALRRKPDATWLSVYPVATEAADWPAEKGLYVNIGGGIGHQCAQFRDRYPMIKGRIILQDLPHSVAQALPTSGVENMAHDMFESQPILGAYRQVSPYPEHLAELICLIRRRQVLLFARRATQSPSTQGAAAAREHQGRHGTRVGIARR